MAGSTWNATSTPAIPSSTNPVAPGVITTMVRIRSTANAAATTAGCTGTPTIRRHSQSSTACNAE